LHPKGKFSGRSEFDFERPLLRKSLFSIACPREFSQRGVATKKNDALNFHGAPHGASSRSPFIGGGCWRFLFSAIEN
jgi:hypothetical protein